MSTNSMSYEATGGTKPKTNARYLQTTSTGEILTHLAYRHRVGLLSTTTVALLAFVIYDKLITLFL